MSGRWPSSTGGWDPNGPLKVVQEANGDSLTITCTKGSSKVKFNLEKFFLDDLSHPPLTSSKNAKAVEVVNIKLDRPAIPLADIVRSKNNDESIINMRKKLKELINIPVDSFKKAAGIKRDDPNGKYIIPGGTRMSISEVHSDKEQPELVKCFLGRSTMTGYLNLMFEKIEVRNFHIDSLFTDDILEDYSNIFILKKSKKNVYELTKAGFGKKYGHYTFYTNDAGYIKEMISTPGEIYY